MCFGCSKEPSHQDGSFEYPQRMFWLRNEKKYFQLRTLIWGPEGLYFWLTNRKINLSGDLSLTLKAPIRLQQTTNFASFFPILDKNKV